MSERIELKTQPYKEFPDDSRSPIWARINGQTVECFLRSDEESPREMEKKGYIKVKNPEPFEELWVKAEDCLSEESRKWLKGIKEGYDAFRQDDDGKNLKEGILKSTRAGWGGSGYSVELFPDGTYQVLWDNQIGNLYDSPGWIFSLPKLNSDTYDDYHDDCEDGGECEGCEACENKYRNDYEYTLEHDDGFWNAIEEFENDFQQWYEEAPQMLLEAKKYCYS